jgi:hypothetical protein
MNQDEYVSGRVDDQIAFYQNAASRAKRWHIFFQVAVILLGLAVPVVVNLPNEVFPGSPRAIQIIVTVMSLMLASFTGIANFRKYGELWLTYRATEEQLKHEKFLWLTNSGRYRNGSESFPEFVEQVEAIISSEHTRFRSIIEESKRPTTPAKREDKTAQT